MVIITYRFAHLFILDTDNNLQTALYLLSVTFRGRCFLLLALTLNVAPIYQVLDASCWCLSDPWKKIQQQMFSSLLKKRATVGFSSCVNRRPLGKYSCYRTDLASAVEGDVIASVILLELVNEETPRWYNKCNCAGFNLEKRLKKNVDTYYSSGKCEEK